MNSLHAVSASKKNKKGKCSQQVLNALINYFSPYE